MDTSLVGVALVNKETKGKSSKLMRCDICGKEDVSFLKVNHRLHGNIKICSNCFEKEGLNLLSSRIGGCPCCR